MSSTSTHAPLGSRLRRYTPALASLSRALFDARGPFHTQFKAAPDGYAPAAGARTVALTIGSAQGVLRLLVDAGAHPAIETISLEADAQLRAALAGLWLAAPLDALARHGAAMPEVRALEAAAAGTPQIGALHLQYQHDGATAIATLLDAPAALAAALAAARGQKGASALGALGTLAVPTRLRLRSRHATPALLQSLRAGDVLLGWAAAPGFARHGALDLVSLVWGAADGHAIGARARIDSRNVILESHPDTMSHDPDLSLSGAAAGASPSAIDVSEVELPVHIEVVTVNLPIGQIAALRPGFILTLPLALTDAEIRLVAHGQTLAFGELVAIGDQLGLHIRRIASSDERQS